jgi:hypothetical protein
MSEAKHTPAPWFDWKKKRWIHEPKKLLANYEDACLIASAPELLEACEAAYSALGFPIDDKSLNRVTNQLAAAIAKAKGGPQ